MHPHAYCGLDGVSALFLKNHTLMASCQPCLAYARCSPLSRLARDDACLSMLPGGYLAAQNFAGVRLGAAEDGFVNFAIRILRQHRAERAVGSHGTATVADREVAAGETVFVFDWMFPPLDKLAPRRALPQHPREIWLSEHVPEKRLAVA